LLTINQLEIPYDVEPILYRFITQFNKFRSAKYLCDDGLIENSFLLNHHLIMDSIFTELMNALRDNNITLSHTSEAQFPWIIRKDGEFIFTSSLKR
jgi:hypothetical protein